MESPIRLRGVNGDTKGRTWTATDLIRIGRLDPLEIVLNDTSVSRYHAEIRFTEKGWRLRDLGSTAGTRLNGVRLGNGMWPLRVRDLLQFGEVALVVESIAYLEGRFRSDSPRRYGSLTVFPVFSDEQAAVEYLLFEEALAAGMVSVKEVSESGSVSTLTVENRSNTRILFLEGEELRGAKQDRILNRSVLVPANKTISIPVSCVEEGRWNQSSPEMTTSKTVCPHHLRSPLKTSVTRSLKFNRQGDSDQATIWLEMTHQHESLGISSATSSLADTHAMHKARLAEALKTQAYVQGCTGMVAAIGKRIVTADLFDKAATCQKAWDWLLSGLLIDELLQRHAAEEPHPEMVAILLNDIEVADWTPVKTIGDGEDFRAEFGGNVGSQLRFQGTLVHGSVVAKG